MRRREFLGLVGGAAVAWPMVARAQRAASASVGLLHTGSAEAWTAEVNALRKGLAEIGYDEGRNLAIEFFWANGQRDRLRTAAADFAGRPVSVIVAGVSSAATAAKAATATVPIVFMSSFDPVAIGLVANLNRPGGNITGVTTLAGMLETKRLELVRELVPDAAVIGMLANAGNVNSVADTKALEASARGLGQRLFVVNANTEAEIELAFAGMSERHARAVIVGTDVLFMRHREKVTALAARYRIPASYPRSEYTEVGGLMSYGTDNVEAYHMLGTYAGRVLKGERPGDLPIIQSSKIEHVVNLKAAKSQGITVPTSILLRADKVIE